MLEGIGGKSQESALFWGCGSTYRKLVPIACLGRKVFVSAEDMYYGAETMLLVLHF